MLLLNGNYYPGWISYLIKVSIFVSHMSIFPLTMELKLPINKACSVFFK